MVFFGSEEFFLLTLPFFFCSVNAHKNIRNLAAGNKPKADGDNNSVHASECSICLIAVAVRERPFRFNPSLLTLFLAALPGPFRRSLLSRLALQVHPSPHFQGMANLSLPQLPLRRRPRS